MHKLTVCATEEGIRSTLKDECATTTYTDGFRNSVSKGVNRTGGI